MVQDGWMCDVDVKFGGVWALEELVPKKTNFRPVRKLLVCLFSTSFSNVIYPRIFARLWYTQASCNQKKFQFFLKISATFLFYCLPGANEPGPFPIIELINTSIGNATLQQTYKLYTTRVYSKLILLESYLEALPFCVVYHYDVLSFMPSLVISCFLNSVWKREIKNFWYGVSENVLYFNRGSDIFVFLWQHVF